MRHLTTKFLVAVGAICLWGSALSAQSYQLGAKIPFDFHVGSKSLPAGSYVAEQQSGSQVQWMVPKDGRRIVVATLSPLTDTGNQPRLVFHRVANEYFLSEIWNGQGTGTRLTVSPAEKAATEAVAANRAEDVTVLMASLR